MSNSRVFDYAEISNLYKQMNTITGDKSDPTSIAGILEQVNLDYTDVVHGVVGEDEMALFGELGQQMLLNWENTSANFPNFVENFDAWSTLVAQAGGDYSSFEQQVQGIRTASPLGWASGGIQDSFITTSVYADALSEQEIADLAAISEFHQLTGAQYYDTGMVSYLKKADIWEGVELALDAVAIVGSIKVLKAAIPQIGAAKSMVTPTTDVNSANGFKTTNKGTSYVYNNSQAARDAGLVQRGKGNLRYMMTQTGDAWQIGSGSTTNKVTQWIANTSNKAGRGYSFVQQLFGGTGKAHTQALGVLRESYNLVGLGAGSNGLKMISGITAATSLSQTTNLIGDLVTANQTPTPTGAYFVSVAAGDTVKIDNKEYAFFAQSPNGTNMVADEDGNLLYPDSSGALQMVTNSNGTQATLDNLDDQTVLYAGTSSLGKKDDLTYAIVERDNNLYYETLDANMDILHN